MRWGLLLFIILMMPFMACADIASTQYVDNVSATKVDTADSAKQTLAGTYTVSGSMTVSGTIIVPTPPLPSAD